MRLAFFPILFFLLFSLLGCDAQKKTHTPPHSIPFSTKQVLHQAKQQGFVEKPLQTDPFLFTLYEKKSHTVPNIHLYIEGDGNSWITKHKLSTNPTPKHPLALQLALRDPHPHILYLARPCQYTAPQRDPHCHPQFWSSHRYAPIVLHALHEALDQIQQKNNHSTFTLIGFSGGGCIAVLLAGTRQDVTGLITVAGDLDHTALNRHHKTSPLHGSVHPDSVMQRLQNRHLPQQHWSASEDTIVPPWVAQQFIQKLADPGCAQHHILKGATHHKGWKEKWPVIITSPLTCHAISSS